LQNRYNKIKEILDLLIVVVISWTMNISISAYALIQQKQKPVIQSPPLKIIRIEPPQPTQKPPQPAKPEPQSPPSDDSGGPQPQPPQLETPPLGTEPSVSPVPVLPAIPEKITTTPQLTEGVYVPDELLVIMPFKRQNSLDEIGREVDIPLLEKVNLKTVDLVIGRYHIPEGRGLFETMTEISLLLEGMSDERVFVQTNNYFEAQGIEESIDYNMLSIHAYEAHRIARGKGVTVALLDTPVDTEHPAYRGRVQEERGIIEKQPPGAHGTALAGIISAKVSPDVNLISIPVCRTEKNRSPRTTSLLLSRGIDLSIQRRVNGINLSLGGPKDTLVGILIDEALKRNIAVVTAAGNSGPNGQPPYPASHTGVIAVTAIDHRDRLDPRATRGPHISLSAPGVDIITSAPGGRQQVSTGTSVAAAHVTGIVALILEHDSKATPQYIKTLLESSAQDLGPPGKDLEFGAGRVDALRALQMALSSKHR